MTKMKRPATLLAAIVAFGLSTNVFTSCNKKAEGITTDSIKFDSTATIGNVKISTKIYADYPTDGNQNLINNVREWINENLEYEYKGDLADGKSAIKASGKQSLDSLLSGAKTLQGMGYETELQRDIQIRKGDETDKFITFQVQTMTYDGGAHGMDVSDGATFRKSDGRKFGVDIFVSSKRDQLQLLIKAGLMEYFKANTDEALRENLLNPDDINFLPLPQSSPFFTKSGICFIYQPYEIACYAAGSPTFIIPYNKVKGLLTRSAAELIP